MQDDAVIPDDGLELRDGPPEQHSDRPRKTTRYLTKYERARVLGTRALQIRCLLDEMV